MRSFAALGRNLRLGPADPDSDFMVRLSPSHAFEKLLLARR
jgi:hypothetical protein